MNISVETAGPCRRQVHVEVPADQVSGAYNDVLSSYAKAAKIPGFRPGRAPRDVVKRRFGKEIAQEVRERLVPLGYREAIKQNKLNSVAVLDVKEKDLREGEVFGFTLTMDVAPEFELPNYKGIALKGEAVAVADADIDSVLTHMREQHASYSDVENRSVQKGDMVRIDFKATLDGRPLAELAPDASSLGESTDFWMMADEENSFLPGMATGLHGAAVGDQRQVAVTFPADFTVKAVAGRKAEYAVTVKAIREKKVPELTEELIKSLGAASEAELRENIRKDFLRMREDNERRRLQNEVVTQLLAGTTMDVPESVLQQETRQVVYDMVQQNTRKGVSNDEIETRKEEIFANASRSATERIKARYILHRIAELEKIEVTPEEVQERMAQLARQYGGSIERVRAELAKNDGMSHLADEVLLTKTMRWLVDQAQITTG